KTSPAKATDAHVSIVAHVTAEELRRLLTETEAANGFGNRFLWACVRRSKRLPEGGDLDVRELKRLAAQVGDRLAFAQSARALKRTDEARELWAGVYEDLSESRPGLAGAM